MTVNEEQARHWNEEGGAEWVAQEERLDRMLSVFLPHLLDAAAPATGEHIVDVGAGAGATTLAVAEAVGPSGRVMALDVSRPLLERLEERAAAAGVTNVLARVADAQTASLPASHFDALVSRFGVMFFDDPAAAFANLARAMKPGGRVAFVCWQPIAENPWFGEPLRAAMAVVPDAALPAPGAPGPFAFADPGRVREALAGAFTDVDVASLRVDLDCGMADEAAAFAARRRMVQQVSDEASEAVKTEVEAAIRRAIEQHVAPDGRVHMAGAAWLVTARRS